MAEYLKTAREKISELGSALGQKAKELGETAFKKTEPVAKVITGNDGQLGVAKKELYTRGQKIDKAVDEALGMANGGQVGSRKIRPQRG